MLLTLPVPALNEPYGTVTTAECAWESGESGFAVGPRQGDHKTLVGIGEPAEQCAIVAQRRRVQRDPGGRQRVSVDALDLSRPWHGREGAGPTLDGVTHRAEPAEPNALGLVVWVLRTSRAA